MPLKISAVGELAALLINETPPEIVPDVCGAKVTVKEALCPGMTVTGKVMPLTENPLPFQSPDEIVTGEVDAVRVAVCVVLLPKATLPKEIVEVEARASPGRSDQPRWNCCSWRVACLRHSPAEQQPQPAAMLGSIET